MMLKILLPAEFEKKEWQIVLEYLQRGQTFSQAEWRLAIQAFDLLKDAVVVQVGVLLPFPVIYQQQVEYRYADTFIQKLYQTEQVEQTSTRLWAETARKIMPDLTQAGLYRPDVTGTRLLVAYCLYWWRSFTLGYSFEIEIQRDLKKSGIDFEMHDLRQAKERFSRYDILISEFKGDIKTSLYFLHAHRTQILSHDFYITRVQGKKGSRTLVVFIQADMWGKIDGETLFVLLSEIVDTLPQAMKIVHQNSELTVIDYEIWKEKIQQYQQGAA